MYSEGFVSSSPASVLAVTTTLALFRYVGLLLQCVLQSGLLLLQSVLQYAVVLLQRVFGVVFCCCSECCTTTLALFRYVVLLLQCVLQYGLLLLQCVVHHAAGTILCGAALTELLQQHIETR